MQDVLREANIMQLPEIAVTGRGDIALEAINSNDPTSDRYTQSLGPNETDHNFTFIFNSLFILSFMLIVCLIERPKIKESKTKRLF